MITFIADATRHTVHWWTIFTGQTYISAIMNFLNLSVNQHVLLYALHWVWRESDSKPKLLTCDFWCWEIGKIDIHLKKRFMQTN